MVLLYNYFSSTKINIFSWSFNIKLSKLIGWIYREVEGYSGPEKHYEPTQHN